VKSSDPTPLVSVIIPCRNEATFIAGCLDSILRNGYPLDRLEVLVVDGMSEDGTREVLDRYAVQHPCIRIIENPRKVTPNALNLGLRQVQGACVLRVDAHAGLAPDYIRGCVDALAQYGADVAGGIMKATPTVATVVGRAIVAAVSHPFGVGNSYFRIHSTDPKWVDTVFCACYRRDVFDRMQVAVDRRSAAASQVAATADCEGPFNVQLARGQDMDFNLRLKRIGGRILLVPSIGSFYYARSDIKSFWSQSWKNGLWAVLPFAYSEGTPISMRHLVPLGFVSIVLGTWTLGLVLTPSLWTCGAIIAAYGAINIAASVHAAWRARSLAMTFIMPIIFFTLHTGYGLGSLWGLAMLASRHRLWRSLKRKRRLDAAGAPFVES
jgi:glycosyltransferase involved in cell wall biosynthesis